MGPAYIAGPTCEVLMTLTRVMVETVTIARRGVQLAFVGMDGITVTGANSSLNDPIASAVRALSGTTADYSTATDTDIQTIPNDKIDGIFDVTEYFVIRTILGHYTKVDITSGPFKANLSQFAKGLRDDMENLKKKMQDEWGVGGLVVEPDVLLQDFAEHEDDNE